MPGNPQPPTGAPAAPPYAGLTPDVVLDALESVGFLGDGRLLALNSYENRVYQVWLDERSPLPGPASGDAAGPSAPAIAAAAASSTLPGAMPAGAASRPASAAAAAVVVKFYRPERWSDAQILEEHEFVGELAAREIPVVEPLAVGARTLHEHQGFRFAVYRRQGGRVAELSAPHALEWMGRFIARMHAVGGSGRFVVRPSIDRVTFGEEPRDFLLANAWIPDDLLPAWESVAAQALDGVRRCYDRAGEVRTLRLHGDCYPGNVLWVESGPEAGPHFVDFDDCRSGPAVQDLWMLLSGDRGDATRELSDLLAGYEEFVDFDRRELHLVEALRTLRLVHYSAWLARRWNDPAFPAAFPWFGTQRYWQDRILELREQVAAMDEPPLGPV